VIRHAGCHRPPPPPAYIDGERHRHQPTLWDALPITGAPNDYDALVDRIGEARCVLTGEASQGTHEFQPNASKEVTAVQARSEHPRLDSSQRPAD
jgi:hypothetical protein